MKELEELIKSKIDTFYRTRYDCEKEFNSFKPIEKGVKGKISGYVKLKKSKKPVWYDSTYELKVLEDLDKCSFVKEIKTQSLAIPYNIKSKYPRKYIPDIQVLLTNNSIALIEIKPYTDMIRAKNLKKYRALRKYCLKNGYGLAYIDQDYFSFEDLKAMQIDEKISEDFLNFVLKKGNVSFTDCNIFKERYNLDNYQICYLVWKNRSKLKYQLYRISFKKYKLKMMDKCL